MRPMRGPSRPGGCRREAASGWPIWCADRRWRWISCCPRPRLSSGVASVPMTLPLLVKSITFEAEDVISLDLRPTGAAPLPRFTAGAHIDLNLGNGLSRSYSLANPQTETHRYVVGVQ